MEQLIVQRLCPGKPVRRIGCNGDDAPLKVVARFADAQIRLLKNYYPIVVLLDRERRSQTADQVATELTEHLNKKGHAGQFIVGIADREVENWILAAWNDITTARPEYKPYEGRSEGENGKSIIRGLLPSGEQYHETTLGVDLFLQCDVRNIYKNSPSFQKFARALTTTCHWLNPIRYN